MSNTATITLNDSTLTSFNLNPTLNPATNANIQSATPSAPIPDGSYSVYFQYQDFLGNPAASSAVSTSVIIDNATLTPTLTTPATGTTYKNTIPIQFTIPETALSGSRTLTFSNGSTTVVLTLKDTTLTNFTLDPTDNPTSNSNVQSSTATSIPDGVYTVTLSYQDALSNPAATSASTSVVVTHDGAATPTPTATPTATPTPTSTPVASSGASSGSDGGGGCLSINDRRNQKPGAPYEPLVWFMVCAGFVWLQRVRTRA